MKDYLRNGRVPSMKQLQKLARTIHPHVLVRRISYPSGVWLGCEGGNDWAELRVGFRASKVVMVEVLRALGANMAVLDA